MTSEVIDQEENDNSDKRPSISVRSRGSFLISVLSRMMKSVNFTMVSGDFVNFFSILSISFRVLFHFFFHKFELNPFRNCLLNQKFRIFFEITFWIKSFESFRNHLLIRIPSSIRCEQLIVQFANECGKAKNFFFVKRQQTFGKLAPLLNRKTH